LAVKVSGEIALQGPADGIEMLAGAVSAKRACRGAAGCGFHVGPVGMVLLRDFVEGVGNTPTSLP
jgi:hypothetical protein